MTQAYNLSQFANKLNSSGQTSNAGLQNTSVTITAGSGLSGGGAVALGGSVALANAGVTALVAGTGISLSGSTGSVTITNSAPTPFASQSFATSGYQVFTNGLIIQWLRVTQFTATNFPIAFPNAVFSCTASTSSVNRTCGVTSLSNSSVTVTSYNPGNGSPDYGTAYVIAFGY